MLKDIQVLNEKETRGGFGEGILEAGLKNPEILKFCQDECAHLRVSSTDDALRQPYKTCRDDCVNLRLGLS